MTFDQCQETLTSLRRKQGTRCPIIRVDYGGTTYRGRVVRSDSDPEHRGQSRPPDGFLVLEDAAAKRRPAIMLQIATLDADAIQELPSP